MTLGAMFQTRSRSGARAGFVLLAALAAAGCGGEPAPDPELIPTDQGERLLTLLDDAERQFQDDQCDELQQTLQDINDEVSAIPNEQVDPDILKTLNSGTEGLIPLSNRCEEPTTVAPPPETTAPPPPETTAPPPPTEETITEEETTTEEETVTEEEPPPEEEAPPETPPGQENGNSNSNSGQGGGGED